DRWAIEQQGVPGLELMERAGASVARAVERLAPDGHVAVVCGKGNNGGDGLVVARLLRQAARRVSVICTSPPSQLSGDARATLDRLEGEGPLRLDGSAGGDSTEPFAGQAGDLAAAVGACSAVVDAVLGTGFAGEPHGSAGLAIDTINRSRA